MNKQIICTLLFLVFVACTAAPEKRKALLNVKPITPLPIGNRGDVRGVSAPFVGQLDGVIYVAGGCNFPGRAAAEGGAKCYYDDIYAYGLTEGVWQQIGALPRPLAYGVSVSYGDRWICMGGNNEISSYSEVLSFRRSADSLVVDTLPSLPYPMDNFAATTVGATLYVVGGVVDGSAQNRLFALNLENSQQWQELASFPGANRVQPQLLRGVNGTLILLGGFQAATSLSDGLLSDEVLCFTPERNQWEVITKLPTLQSDGSTLALVGGFGVTLRDSLLLVGGGVNSARFSEALNADRNIAQSLSEKDYLLADSIRAAKKSYLHHPVAWYNFTDELFVFNLYSGKWHSLGRFAPTARAGAGVLFHHSKLYIIGGELKPGIRTDVVSEITIE